MLPIGMKISMDINQEILLKMSLAILHEKDKEFVQEEATVPWGPLSRYDSEQKGGKHLVFCKRS